MSTITGGEARDDKRTFFSPSNDERPASGRLAAGLFLLLGLLDDLLDLRQDLGRRLVGLQLDDAGDRIHLDLGVLVEPALALALGVELELDDHEVVAARLLERARVPALPVQEEQDLLAL